MFNGYGTVKRLFILRMHDLYKKYINLISLSYFFTNVVICGRVIESGLISLQ